MSRVVASLAAALLLGCGNTTVDPAPNSWVRVFATPETDTVSDVALDGDALIVSAWLSNAAHIHAFDASTGDAQFVVPDQYPTDRRLSSNGIGSVLVYGNGSQSTVTMLQNGVESWSRALDVSILHDAEAAADGGAWIASATEHGEAILGTPVEDKSGFLLRMSETGDASLRLLDVVPLAITQTDEAGGLAVVGNGTLEATDSTSGFVAQLGSNGEMDWFLPLLGEPLDVSHDVRIVRTRAGSVVFAARFSESLQIGDESFHANEYETGCLVAKLDASGKPDWAISLAENDPGSILVTDLLLNANDDVVLVGHASRGPVTLGTKTFGHDGPPFFGAGAADGFVAVLDGNTGEMVSVWIERDAFITSAASVAPDELVVGGAFTGQLEWIAPEVVSSGASDEAFVARVKIN